MMDSCTGVEQDLDKALAKFNSLNDNANRMLQDVIDQVEFLRREIAKQPPNAPLTHPQSLLVSDVANTIKQSVFQMSTEHRELHASVSRVGKSIDRHFIADYAAVAPRAESFCTDTNRPLMHQAIAQHLYRQGLEEVGDSFVAEGQVSGVERACTFAILQRCAAALAEGDPSLALEWVEKRADQLTHSPLPFALHRMQALKLARSEGVVAAVDYARRTFPAHAARHERALQASVCALAWCTPHAPSPPLHYRHLLDERASGTHPTTVVPLLARSQSVVAAVEYARRTFLIHAARHERALQASVCALPWCMPHAPPAPPHFRHLLDERATGTHPTTVVPQLARSHGVVAAAEYAQRTFPAHAARFERARRASVCALAWCAPHASPPPPRYRHLLDERATGTHPTTVVPQLARSHGVVAAVEYARRTFPAHVARHERALRASVCALAWCAPHAPPLPPHYRHLLDERATGAEASELFIKEACSLLRLAPLSPLAGAVAAGCKVLPALHDIRAKMSHPHVIAAWSDDELPFEVDLGEDGGNYHSVFACPILRQQASQQNPPMRLLCGHVISRDALNKLATGAKLKCPYCPMEQSPSEARQIYFS